MLMAIGIELFLAFPSGLMVFNWRRAVLGTLDRNAYVGIRTAATLRSQEAWVAANRVGLRSAPLFVLFNIGMFAALFSAAWHGWRLAVAFIGGAGVFALIFLLVGTTYFANKAANAVDAHTAHRARPPSPTVDFSLEPPRLIPQLSARMQAMLTWVSAAAACGFALFLLGTMVDGYVLALHQHLVPADQFGFRDETTTSCWARWYPSQKAGFQWFLFGYGPVLIASMAMYIGAAIKRRPPIDIWVLVLAMVFAVLPFLIAAAIHAGHVARAITC
jgi:Na+-transporting methylmalonyl-CoA/oxaloacetate decarboxylase gamma subunit